MNRLIAAARALDSRVHSKLGLARVSAAWRRSLPEAVRSAVGRYLPLLVAMAMVAAYTGALSDPGLPGPGGRSGGRSGALDLGDPGSTNTAVTAAEPLPSTTAEAARRAAEVARQAPALQTQNVCGRNGLLDTGRNTYPHAPQCLEKFAGDNGGATHRGVDRDEVRVAFYISQDPQTIATTQAVGGCAQAECWQNYYEVFIDWLSKYYERYGRNIKMIFVKGTGREDNVEFARLDADRIAGLDPPVFAAVGGPLQAGPVYAARLASRGILCFCTVSVPQEIYEQHAPYVYATLMSSTQAYIHRAEYIGKRLAGKNAVFAGDSLTKERKREFALVYFDNFDNDYESGIEFFKRELEKYDVKLNAVIEYTNIEGCQIDAANMVFQLIESKATSVIFSGDPLCPINLTEQAERQQAKWEWIVTGSYLTDVATLARRYNQAQWSRAFGVSMLAPEVKDENEAWYKMYKEAQGNRRDPRVDTPLFLAGPALLMTGIHLAGPKLTPASFREGMAKVVPRGGTPTVPKWTMGPKRVSGTSFWDATAYDDMSELWWDPNSNGPDGNRGTYWFAKGGKRYDWGEWPRADPDVFDKSGAVSGFEFAPDVP